MQWLYSSLVSSFGADFAGDASAIADLGAYGWYSTPSPQAGLRIVGLNTNYWTALNPLVFNTSSPAALLGDRQLQWLNATLANASAAGEKVYIIAHIPPESWMPGRYDQFRLILTPFRSTVVAEFFGHDHLDEFMLVRECNEPPPPSPAPNGTIEWIETKDISWCSGGNWACGDVFGQGLQDGDAWCPLLPAGSASAQVEACESVCGNSTLCRGFTYYPASAPNGACCMRTNTDSKPPDANSSAVCYEKPAPPTACGPEEDATPMHVLFVAPSLTEGYPPSNPALRRYEVADASGGFAVLDSVTSFANITKANEDWSLLFEPEYRATKQYGLADMSAASFAGLVARMAVDGSDEWRQYYASQTKLYTGSTPACVAGRCKDNVLALCNGTRF